MSGGRRGALIRSLHLADALEVHEARRVLLDVRDRPQHIRAAQAARIGALVLTGLVDRTAVAPRPRAPERHAVADE